MPSAHRPLEQRLHRACLEQALDAGRGAGFAVEVASPAALDLPADIEQRRQVQGSFGHRVSKALEDAFVRHQGPWILVGSDVPGLTVDHLQRTRRALQEDPSRVVIGPSPDGGFYLLATAQPLEDALDGVRWCCRETLSSLRRALAKLGRSVVLLSPLADLDCRSDLERWLAEGRRALGRLDWNQLTAQLLQILARLRQGSATSQPAHLLARHLQRQVPRGPPIPDAVL